MSRRANGCRPGPRPATVPRPTPSFPRTSPPALPRAAQNEGRDRGQRGGEEEKGEERNEKRKGKKGRQDTVRKRVLHIKFSVLGSGRMVSGSSVVAQSNTHTRTRTHTHTHTHTHTTLYGKGSHLRILPMCPDILLVPPEVVGSVVDDTSTVGPPLLGRRGYHADR